MKAIEKIKAGNIDLSEDEIIELLRINNFSSEYYGLLAASNALSRRKFGNRGYVFTQIGINAEPCPINCNFCSMAATHYSLNDKWKKSVEDICQEVQFLKKSSKYQPRWRRQTQGIRGKLPEQTRGSSPSGGVFCVA